MKNILIFILILTAAGMLTAESVTLNHLLEGFLTNSPAIKKLESEKLKTQYDYSRRIHPPSTGRRDDE
jgi:hypothetical protein